MLPVVHLAVSSRIVVCSLLRYLCTMSKPRCFFDVTAGGKSIGRVVIEVGNKLSRNFALQRQSQIRPLASFPHVAWERADLAELEVIDKVLLVLFAVFLQLRSDVVPKTAGQFLFCVW